MDEFENTQNRLVLLNTALDYVKLETKHEGAEYLCPGYLIFVAKHLEHYVTTGENPFDGECEDCLQESLKGAEVV